jgi:hypothetical protein
MPLYNGQHAQLLLRYQIWISAPLFSWVSPVATSSWPTLLPSTASQNHPTFVRSKSVQLICVYRTSNYGFWWSFGGNRGVRPIPDYQLLTGLSAGVIQCCQQSDLCLHSWSTKLQVTCAVTACRLPAVFTTRSSSVIIVTGVRDGSPENRNSFTGEGTELTQWCWGTRARWVKGVKFFPRKYYTDMKVK